MAFRLKGNIHLCFIIYLFIIVFKESGCRSINGESGTKYNLLKLHEQGVNRNRRFEENLKPVPHRSPFSWDALQAGQIALLRHGFPQNFDINLVLPTQVRFVKTAAQSWETWYSKFWKFCNKIPLNFTSENAPADCLWDQVVNQYAIAEKATNENSNINGDNLAVAYVYFVCSRTTYPRICPDPCVSHPCKSIRHSTGECYTRANALTKSDYDCECELSFTWSPAHHSCNTRTDVCSPALMIYPCHRKNTQLCQMLEDSFVCICVKGYKGQICEIPMNPCQEKLEKSTRPPGNLMCAHGLCIPTMGSEKYACVCEDGWEDTPSDPLPDCKTKKPPPDGEQSVKLIQNVDVVDTPGVPRILHGQRRQVSNRRGDHVGKDEIYEVLDHHKIPQKKKPLQLIQAEQDIKDMKKILNDIEEDMPELPEYHVTATVVMPVIRKRQNIHDIMHRGRHSLALKVAAIMSILVFVFLLYTMCSLCSRRMSLPRAQQVVSPEARRSSGPTPFYRQMEQGSMVHKDWNSAHPKVIGENRSFPTVTVSAESDQSKPTAAAPSSRQSEKSHGRTRHTSSMKTKSERASAKGSHQKSLSSSQSSKRHG